MNWAMQGRWKWIVFTHNLLTDFATTTTTLFEVLSTNKKHQKIDLTLLNCYKRTVGPHYMRSFYLQFHVCAIENWPFLKEPFP
jgi:hypothetical protein